MTVLRSDRVNFNFAILSFDSSPAWLGYNSLHLVCLWLRSSKNPIEQIHYVKMIISMLSVWFFSPENTLDPATLSLHGIKLLWWEQDIYSLSARNPCATDSSALARLPLFSACVLLGANVCSVCFVCALCLCVIVWNEEGWAWICTRWGWLYNENRAEAFSWTPVYILLQWATWKGIGWSDAEWEQCKSCTHNLPCLKVTALAAGRISKFTVEWRNRAHRELIPVPKRPFPCHLPSRETAVCSEGRGGRRHGRPSRECLPCHCLLSLQGRAGDDTVWAVVKQGNLSKTEML